LQAVPSQKQTLKTLQEEWNRLGLESAVEETLKNIEEYVSTYRAGLFRQVQAAKTPYQPEGSG
jgi:hypothetical protein